MQTNRPYRSGKTYKTYSKFLQTYDALFALESD